MLDECNASAVRYALSPASGTTSTLRLRAGRSAMRAVRLSTVVSIRLLGAFAVFGDGVEVPSGAWQSRKARSLVKLLAARRGRPTPREVVMEALWPEQDPSRVANRLSVAISTARAVLDPAHRLQADRFIHSDRDSIELSPEHVTIDVERFLADARAGLSLYGGNRREEAREPLERAEAAYVGDFLEQDMYEDWAVSPREEARAAYMATASTLSALADDREDTATAIFMRLRVLELDPYDEKTHLDLVRSLLRSGRHGDASRAYRRYTTRMDEIGVEPTRLPAGPAPAD